MATTPADDPSRQGRFFTPKELAERWAVSEKTVYNLTKRGQLKRTMIAGAVRYSPAEVARYERVS